MKRASAQGSISPSTIEAIRYTLRISQEGPARILGISLRTVVRWEREGFDDSWLSRAPKKSGPAY